MTDIIKLIYLDQDNIKKIIVFFGDKGIDDINGVFMKDRQNPLFKGVFSKDSNPKNSNTLFLTSLNIDSTTAGLVPDINAANISARNIDFTSKISRVKPVKKIKLNTKNTTESHNVRKEK